MERFVGVTDWQGFRFGHLMPMVDRDEREPRYPLMIQSLNRRQQEARNQNDQHQSTRDQCSIAILSNPFAPFIDRDQNNVECHDAEPEKPRRVIVKVGHPKKIAAARMGCVPHTPKNADHTRYP